METNLRHSEERWTVPQRDGDLECFKTIDDERTEVGHQTLNGGDGGLTFKIIRVKARHWWHHLHAEDPGFKTHYELEIAASHFGVGYHTTIPLEAEGSIGALQGAIDMIKKDILGE